MQLCRLMNTTAKLVAEVIRKLALITHQAEQTHLSVRKAEITLNAPRWWQGLVSEIDCHFFVVQLSPDSRDGQL